MKRLQFCFLFLLCISQLVAQEVQLSEPQKLTNKTPRFRVIGQNLDGIILRRYGRGNDFFDVFDRSLRFKYSVPVITRQPNSYTKKILLNQHGATIFYVNQTKNYSTLNARLLSKQFKESNRDVILDTINDTKDLVTKNFRDVVSQDNLHILFYHPFYELESLKSVQMTVIGRDLKKVCETEFNVKSIDQEANLVSVLLDNENNAFFFVDANPDNDDADQKGSKFIVYRYNCQEKSLKSFNINLEHRFFKDPVFSIDNRNDQIVISGFMKDTEKKGREAAVGFLSIILDKSSGAIKSSLQSEFSNDFIFELTGKDTSTKQSKQLFTFELRKVILRQDGGSIIIAESFYKETDELSGAGTISPAFSNYRSVNIYFYNDIVVFSIDTNGTIDWQTILRKKQISENDNGAYSSFGLMNVKNKLLFIYLEEIFPRSNLNNYTLYSNGTVERDFLFNLNEEEVMPIPKLAKQISERELVMPSLRKNLLRLVKLTY